MKKIIKADRIFTGTEVVEYGWLEMTDGKIAGVYSGNPGSYDYDCAALTPGFIDTHLHGGNGADVMDGSVEGLAGISGQLPFEGVTSWLPATAAAERKKTCAALSAVAEAASKSGRGAEIIGAHLEGPYVAKEYRGAMNAAAIRLPDVCEFEEFQSVTNGSIRIVTCAPELDGGMDFIRHLSGNGITVSLGHSNATFEQAKTAIAAGATQATHTFHAMRGLHHREPGLLGAVMYYEREIMAELGAFDGIGMRPEILQIFYRLKGFRNILLTTDAGRLKGLPDGEYCIDGRQYSKSGLKIMTAGGTLAGSALTMLDSIRNIMRVTGCGLYEIVCMAAVNPARQAGAGHKKGRLQSGMDADILMFDDSMELLGTFCRGELFARR